MSWKTTVPTAHSRPGFADVKIRKSAAAKVALFLWVVSPGGAQAEARVSSYSHGWGVGSDGFVYFPHALAAIDSEGEAQQTYGFSAKQGRGIQAFVRRGKGEVRPADPRYVAQSRLHFQISVKEADQAKANAWLKRWRNDDTYDLRQRNCITFILELARELGLKTPRPDRLDPAVILEKTRKLNALAEPVRSPMERSDPAWTSDPVEPEPDLSPAAR